MELEVTQLVKKDARSQREGVETIYQCVLKGNESIKMDKELSTVSAKLTLESNDINALGQLIDLVIGAKIELKIINQSEIKVMPLGGL